MPIRESWWPWRRSVQGDPTPAPVDPRLRVLAEALPGWRCEVRRTRRSLLGMRRARDGGLVLRVHPEVLNVPDWSVSITEWARRRGRGGAGAGIRRLLATCQRRMAEHSAADDGDWAGSQPTLGALADDPGLPARRGEDIRAAWFPDLPPAPARWGRSPPRRRLSHLRFGCYRRRDGAIELSPRLARPWIAVCFLDHVLHHEYCHHRQARQPTARREGVHSPRFRCWERAFPGYADALRWERLALPWLLDDAPPPWYRPQRSNP